MTNVCINMDGATIVHAVIGDPIKQVKIVAPLTELMQARGQNAVIIPLQISADTLEASFLALRSMPNFAGMIITIPHKVAMAQLVDSLSERSKLAGAVNICARGADGQWHGDILDGFGFAEGLVHKGSEIRGTSALVIGCGGAGSAVAAELAIRGAKLGLFDLEQERAARLAQRLRDGGYQAETVSTPDPRGFDLVTNASPVGMGEDTRIPLDTSLLDASVRVAELVMLPRETPLLKQAIKIGCPVSYGSDVMNFQMAAMADSFARAVVN